MQKEIRPKKPGCLSFSEIAYLSMRPDRKLEDYPYEKKPEPPKR